jgi:hypothetical protein
MVRITQASTVAIWREMFLKCPNLNFNDYRKEWADLQNEAEGIDQTVKSAGLVAKYLKMFKAEALQAGEIQFKPSGMVSLESVITESVPFDAMAEMLIIQSELVGLAAEAEGLTTQCRYLAEVLGKAVDIMTDNHIIANLTAQTSKMQSEIDSLKRHLEVTETKAKEEREFRNRPIHGEATR